MALLRGALLLVAFGAAYFFGPVYLLGVLLVIIGAAFEVWFKGVGALWLYPLLALASLMFVFLGSALWSSRAATRDPELKPMSITEAIELCQHQLLDGWELVEYAQDLVAQRMQYSVRTPLDGAETAFSKGMGYCMQQALALKKILDGLGVENTLVYAQIESTQRRVIDGIQAEQPLVGGHAWLRVRVGEEELDVDPSSVKNSPGKVSFRSRTEPKPLGPLLIPFAHLGSIYVNVKRDQQLRRGVSL